jgi:hypothetical protein
MEPDGRESDAGLVGVLEGARHGGSDGDIG